MTARDIPTAIKREVRQACFFGCAVCGAPVYEYDHITPWEEVHEHDPENIVAVCANHHSGKTRSFIHPDRLRRCRKFPANRDLPVTKSTFPLKGGLATKRIRLGNCTWGVEGEPTVHLVVVDGHSLGSLRFEEGFPEFSFVFLDQSNAPLMIVEDGEVTHTTKAWDITATGGRYQVHLEKTAPAVLDIALDAARETIVIRRATFQLNGIRLEVTPDGIWLPAIDGGYQRCTFNSEDRELIVFPFGSTTSEVPHWGLSAGDEALRIGGPWEQQPWPVSPGTPRLSWHEVS